jgi:ABC-type amino acid transport substrate-binding protein
MYRIASVALLILLLGCSAIACGSGSTRAPTGREVSPAVKQAIVEPITPEQTVKLLNGKTLAVIARARSPEEDEKDYELSFKDDYNLNLNLAEEVYASNINDCLQLIRDHKADAFEVLGATAYYIVQQNADLKMYNQEYRPSTVHMLFNKTRERQFNQVDAVIRAMMSDGTIKSLEKQWIEDRTVGTMPTPSSLPRFEGQDTLKVGYTGEEPPMDYLADSGAPSGYGMAVLAEIGSRANLNFEMIKVNTKERFTTLQSGSIDAFLWKTEMGTVDDYPESKIYEDIDPSVYNFIFTYPYLETTRALIVLK